MKRRKFLLGTIRFGRRRNADHVFARARANALPMPGGATGASCDQFYGGNDGSMCRSHGTIGISCAQRLQSTEDVLAIDRNVGSIRDAIRQGLYDKVCRDRQGVGNHHGRSKPLA